MAVLLSHMCWASQACCCTGTLASHGSCGRMVMLLFMACHPVTHAKRLLICCKTRQPFQLAGKMTYEDMPASNWSMPPAWQDTVTWHVGAAWVMALVQLCNIAIHMYNIT